MSRNGLAVTICVLSTIAAMTAKLHPVAIALASVMIIISAVVDGRWWRLPNRFFWPALISVAGWGGLLDFANLSPQTFIKNGGTASLVVAAMLAGYGLAWWLIRSVNWHRFRPQHRGY